MNLFKKNSLSTELFVDFAKQRGLPVGYFSNIALIGDKLFPFLEKNVGNIKFIQTTLDALSAEHNKHSKDPKCF